MPKALIDTLRVHLLIFLFNPHVEITSVYAYNALPCTEVGTRCCLQYQRLIIPMRHQDTPRPVQMALVAHIVVQIRGIRPVGRARKLAAA
jgi:hypothetical protein